MADIEQMERVLGYIESHPEQHDQGTWYHDDEGCGTTACFAGWACLLNGDVIDASSNSIRVPTSDGEAFVSVPSRAANLLDLSNDEANNLFFRCANLAELKAVVKDIANGDDLQTCYCTECVADA